MQSLDAAAEALIADALVADTGDAEDFGPSGDALRALIAQGHNSGAALSLNAEAVRSEVLQKFAASGRTV